MKSTAGVRVPLKIFLQIDSRSIASEIARRRRRPSSFMPKWSRRSGIVMNMTLEPGWL